MGDDYLFSFLEHHGIKGMQWGVRKKEDNATTDSQSKVATSNSKSNNKGFDKKKAAIILGSAVGITALTVGAVYAKKHFGVSVTDVVNSPNKAKDFADAMAKEPVGIVHAARGKHLGFCFPQHGGLSNPLTEYEKTGLHSDMSPTFFKRYGDRNEKVAARFLDPQRRKDFAGRDIFHEVMLPESLSVGITKHSDVELKAWPLIKDIYNAMYEKMPQGFENRHP